MLSSHQEQEKNKRNIAIIEKVLSDQEDHLLDKEFIDALPIRRLSSFEDKHNDEFEYELRKSLRKFDSLRHKVSLFEKGVHFRIIQNQKIESEALISALTLRNEYFLVNDNLYYVNSQAQLIKINVNQIDRFKNKIKNFLKENKRSYFDFEKDEYIEFYLYKEDYQKLFDGHIDHCIDFSSVRRKYIEEIADHAGYIIDTCSNKDLVLILGQTGDGKSTLINALLGIPLKKVREDKHDRDIWDIESHNTNTLRDFAEMGHGSETKTQFLRVHQGENNVLLIDTPGFSDMADNLTNYRHHVALSIAMKYARSIKIICVLDIETILRNRLFQHLKSNPYHSFKNLINFINDVKATPKSSLILALTKKDEFFYNNIMTSQECLERVHHFLDTIIQDNEIQEFALQFAKFINSIETKIVVDYMHQEELRNQFYDAFKTLNPITLDQFNPENFPSIRCSLLQNYDHKLMLDFFSVLKKTGLFYTNATAEIALRAFYSERQRQQKQQRQLSSIVSTQEPKPASVVPTPKPNRCRFFSVALTSVACGVVAVASAALYEKFKPR